MSTYSPRRNLSSFYPFVPWAIHSFLFCKLTLLNQLTLFNHLIWDVFTSSQKIMMIDKQKPILSFPVINECEQKVKWNWVTISKLCSIVVLANQKSWWVVNTTSLEACLIGRCSWNVSWDQIQIDKYKTGGENLVAKFMQIKALCETIFGVENQENDKISRKTVPIWNELYSYDLLNAITGV